MRLVFVNHAHPNLSHVSGMRLGYFAVEMARRGHQVVLLTCALPASTAVDPTGPSLTEQLNAHDWTRPMVVAIPPVRRRALDLIRHNRVPAIVRRVMTAWQLVIHGGMFADWHKAAEGAIAQLSDEFRPDAVWGTFGNTTNLTIAQQLARHAGCPWVMDIKDNWTAFVPRLIRRPMAWRFRDAAGWTSNCRHHQEVAIRWFRQRPTEVIYSGVAEEFFGCADPSPDSERRQLLLLGSVYDDARLAAYLAAVREWMESLPPEERESALFIYAGTDDRRVADAVKRAALPCAVRILGHRSIGELARIARASFANTYLFASFTFHHKLLELLVCGRPVICFPAEHAEDRELASQTATMFESCDTAADLRGALAVAWATRRDEPGCARLPAWRWSDFAESLERFLERCRQERTA